MTIDLSHTFRLRVDNSAIAQNYRLLSRASEAATCGVAVKANAYGCGIGEIVPVLIKEGCQDLFVADAYEGALVRNLAPKANIYILCGFIEEAANLIKQHKLTPVINTQNQLNAWRSSGHNSPFALHVDTGMNRLGVRFDQAPEIIEQLNTKPDLLMSHFASADDVDNPKNTEQLAKFRNIRNQFPQIDASMANSAAILSLPQSAFEKTRAGIALYGANPIIANKNQMQTAVTADSRIIDIKQVKRGETISYGGTFQAPNDMKIAICGVGYADGYPRMGSGQGVPLRRTQSDGAQAFINGHMIPILGRITMDLTIFDISEIPEHSINVGDWVELFGHNMPIEQLALAAGTVSYEILTSMGRSRYRASTAQI